MAVAPALTSLLAIVERAANALSKLMSSVLAVFGIKTDFSKSFKGTDTATQTMADNTSETADNIDDATDSQKKFNKAQQGALAGYYFILLSINLSNCWKLLTCNDEDNQQRSL